jgi:hypothetical protein
VRVQQQRALVRNAADRDQVKRAERIERDADQRYLVCLRAVMMTYEGREFVALEFERLGLHMSTFDPHGSISNFNQGRHNAALELLAKVEQAGDQGPNVENLYELMMRERRLRRQLADRATDASHTPRASEPEGETDDRSS